jgi:hypothetical protein
MSTKLCRCLATVQSRGNSPNVVDNSRGNSIEWSSCRFCPSREENLLSDHVYHFFGRAVTITSSEQFMAILVLVVAATAWAVQQFRRRRAVVLQRSTVSDQLVYELSRIADALDRISTRPVDPFVAAPTRETERDESTGGRIPLSMFGR